jgi:hypothetical protein
LDVNTNKKEEVPDDEDMVTDQTENHSQPPVKGSATITENKYKEWLDLKYATERDILRFMERILREVYGDKMWDKMFDLDIKRFTLKDGVRTLRQGWYGVFAEAFHRNRGVKNLVDDVFLLLKDEDKHCDKLMSRVSDLRGSIRSLPRASGAPLEVPI